MASYLLSVDRAKGRTRAMTAESADANPKKVDQHECWASRETGSSTGQ
jgi:hypothetical protein